MQNFPRWFLRNAAIFTLLFFAAFPICAEEPVTRDPMKDVPLGKLLFWDRIHPIYESGQWRFIDHDGEKIDDNTYDHVATSRIPPHFYDDHTIYHAKKGERWYRVTAAATTEIELPEGYNVAEYYGNGRYLVSHEDSVELEGAWKFWACPLHLFDLHAKKFLIRNAQEIHVRGNHLGQFIPMKKIGKPSNGSYHYFSLKDGREIVFPIAAPPGFEFSRYTYYGDDVLSCSLKEKTALDKQLEEGNAVESDGKGETGSVPAPQYKHCLVSADSGEILFIAPEKSSISPFRNGCGIINISTESGPRHDYLIDRKGNKLSDAYDQMEFAGELVRVKRKSKVGYINYLGEEVISCEYFNGSYAVNGLVLVSQYGGDGDIYRLLNRYGEIVRKDFVIKDEHCLPGTLMAYGAECRTLGYDRQDDAELTCRLVNIDGKTIWEGTLTGKQSKRVSRYYGSVIL